MKGTIEAFFDDVRDSIKVVYDASDDDEIPRQMRVIMLKLNYLLTRAEDKSDADEDVLDNLRVALGDLIDELPNPEGSS